ncbi:hypothetical protein [Candidatus Phytoplasma bonamiae]|uniref:Uncharacterized protein n=1 Tax=Candidatus Phytoplasma bonamiae TaxID=2982626 RepID=A0ABT9D3P6_9MOLU|nr:hypothetical protein ['Bonamia sp.' little leaf phytoplasma]MDO8064052.1 hypothetical protein ['Bonamia sp.' little leaf phytoplasma]
MNKITNQIPTPLSASKSEEETLKSEKLLSPSAIKSPKTTISPKIKTYFFTEPVDVLEREKEEIVELKKSRPSSLDLLKDSKNPINEYQHQYDEHQSQLNALLPFQIASVKQQKILLEKDEETKKKELKPKQEEIEKIQKERSKIVGEISKIPIQIGKLENEQERYQEILSDADNHKKELETRYERTAKEYKNLFLSSRLNSFYTISSAEG